jgi:hypothetical protein
VYHQAEIRRVIANAVAWARPRRAVATAPYEAIESERGWFERR